MEKTVALYLRVSTKHQDTPEGSLISQEQRLIEWYDYHNSQAKHSKEKDPISKYVIYKDIKTGTGKYISFFKKYLYDDFKICLGY